MPNQSQKDFDAAFSVIQEHRDYALKVAKSIPLSDPAHVRTLGKYLYEHGAELIPGLYMNVADPDKEVERLKKGFNYIKSLAALRFRSDRAGSTITFYQSGDDSRISVQFGNIGITTIQTIFEKAGVVPADTNGLWQLPTA